ncbi:DNA-binding transcriptional LysR family regulator [Sphingomonas zeicaulis]|uniref:LysR family transcriptional regulator n=1 Tax=Sphingomonas zeicaulis TaxID=1632740 RepID=UPI003D25D292
MLFDGRIIAGITVFVAVARTGSYARASELLGLSRSGVGKAIGRLEERTGLRLFDRNARALKLTDQGRTFLEEATPMLEALGRIATPAGPNDVRGRLRVSTDGAFGPDVLIPMLPDFLAAYPRVKLDVLVRDRIDNLLIEGFDVALRFGEPDSRGLDKQLLIQSRVLTCASPAYLEAFGVPGHPEDITDHHRCIRLIDDVTGKPHAWNFIDAAGETRTISPDCSLTVNDAQSLIAAARAGYGIVRLLDVVGEAQLRAGELVEILPEWNCLRWPAYLYTPNQVHRSPALEAFMAFVRKRLTD